MTTKATLIQASNNIATGKPIFTFKLEYPIVRRFWRRFFNLEPKQTIEYHTVTRVNMLTSDILTNKKVSLNNSLALVHQVEKLSEFVVHIFDCLESKSKNTITGADLQKAMELFGPRMNDVLKQFDPRIGGPENVHNPKINDEPYYKHRYAPCLKSNEDGYDCKDGWANF